jgi:hypothetical protein
MIQDARYTSPSGKEATFFWESTKRSTELKTGVYTFPGRNGAHVQHQGAGARTFPLVCIFSGKDYITKADEFEAMLIERGIAELRHPLYGTVKVVPTGNIEREDDAVNKIGESTVTITFTETITSEEAAELNEVAAEAIDEKFDEFSEAAAADFAAAIDTENITTQMDIKSALETQTQSIIDNLEPLASTDKKTFADWLASARELKDNIKNLYSKAKGVAGKIESVYTKALNIGRLTLRLMKLPSSIVVSLAEKIKGYSTLTANLINQYKNDPIGIEKIKAAYTTATLALTGAVAAIASNSALTVAEIAIMTGATSKGISGRGKGTAAKNINASIGTMSREKAIEISDQIITLLDNVTAFKDEKIISMEASGEDTRAVKQIVDDIINFTCETILMLKNAITTDVPFVVIQYVNELISLKNDEIRQLRESLGKSANKPARILEDAIILVDTKKREIEAAGGEKAGQIVEVIDGSLAFENDNKNKLKSMAGSVTGSFVDSSPDSHLSLYEVVHAGVLLITNASFALPMKKTITLDRDRQAVELCAELYGTTDYLDEFIIENNFNIDEIELLPMGKRVSYYVKSA